MPKVIERLNENAYIRYPFVGDADMEGVSGSNTIQIPNSLLLEMFIISYAQNRQTLTLESLEIDGGGINMTANFDYGGVPLAIPVSAAIVAPYQAELRIPDSYGHTELLIRPVFGEAVAQLCADYPGETFSVNSIPIEPSRTATQNKHRVNTVVGGESGSDVLTGLIDIQDGYNVRTSISQATNTLRISAALGAGEGTPCASLYPNPTNCGDLVYFINGLHPNWYGEFSFVGGPGISVESDPANNKIKLHTSVDHCRPKCKDPGEA